jgi:simple sugar transport system permease protein
MWNLGIDGQFYLGAVAAAWVGYKVIDVPGWVTIIVAMGAAAIAGGLWGAIPGWLRARTGASELVTTLMFNYVAILISDFMVLGPMRYAGPQGTTIRSPLIAKAANLPRIIPRTPANIGFIIAIVMAIVLYFVIRRTTTGYEMRMAGSNRWFAQCGGINITRTLVTAMVISGAIAGLAGAVEVLGVHRAFVARLSTNLGFDGIVVSLLAQNNPLGVIASGLFFAALRTGSMAVERNTEVPRAMVSIIQSIIIFGATAQGIWLLFRSESKLWKRIKDRFTSAKA